MQGSTHKYRLKNSTKVSWGYHFRPRKDQGGRWIRITKQGFATQREAEEALKNAIEQEKQGIPQPATPVGDTFGEFFHGWIEQYAHRHCAPKTVERYEQLGAYAIAHFGSVPLKQITSYTLECAFNAISDSGGQKTAKYPNGRPLSPKTVRHVAFLVYGVLKKAKAWRKVDENAADFEKITLPKLPKRKARIVEKGSFAHFLQQAKKTRLRPLLFLAAATGCRRGELLALQWHDLDFETRVLQVSKSLEETKAGIRVKSTKSGEPRSFVVPRPAIEALLVHRDQQNQDKTLFGVDYEDNDLIFCRPDGRYYKPDKVSVRVTELARKCGLTDVGLHSLRHTHASQLLSSGVPLAVVSERLGHSSPNITLGIYTHALKADELAAAKLWEDAMADVIENEMKSGDAKVLSESVRTKLKKVG